MESIDVMNPYWVECWDMGSREELSLYCFSLQSAVSIAWRESVRFEMVQITNPKGEVEYSPQTIQEAFKKYMALMPSRAKAETRATLRVIK